MNVKALLTGGIQRLSHANRYSTYHVNRRENVAEHTCYVALYCLMIGRELEKTSTLLQLDWPKLMQTALLHDIDEALTGDFLRSVKYKTAGLKAYLDEAARLTVKSLETELGVELTSVWDKCKDDSLEGFILRTADFLGVASYVIGEFHSGNRHLVHIFSELHDYLGILIKEIPNRSERITKLLTTMIEDTQKILSETYNLVTGPMNSEYIGSAEMPKVNE